MCYRHQKSRAFINQTQAQIERRNSFRRYLRKQVMAASKTWYFAEINPRQKSLHAMNFEHWSATNTLVVDVHHANHFIAHNFVAALLESSIAGNVISRQTAAWF